MAEILMTVQQVRFVVDVLNDHGRPDMVRVAQLEDQRDVIAVSMGGGVGWLVAPDGSSKEWREEDHGAGRGW